MYSQSTALERVQAFAQKLRAQHLSLRRVVLFGSYASNEQRKSSDIDVALVADEFNGFGFHDVGLIGDVLSEKQFLDIEAHTFSPAQFTDWNPFVQEINRTGIVIGEWESAATENQAIYM